MSTTLFTPFTLGTITLKNRVVMAPMTRNRATTGHDVTPIMATYYAQRASAGLIITEGVAPSANGNGYARVPGIYTPAQVAGWKAVTTAVHEKDGKIFAQLMHTGRVSHPIHMEAGAKIVAPSAIAAGGQIYTDEQGMLDHPTPEVMTKADIDQTIQEFVTAAQNAITAGFDGVEVHGANGYLVEQFLRPTTNQRTDEYGGSTENYARFAVEVVTAVSNAIGAEKVGIRLSPYGIFNDTPYSPEYDAIALHVAEKINGLAVYVHLVDHQSMGAPAVAESIVEGIRAAFKGTLILSGGYDANRAETTLAEGKAQLIAFGRPFIANPDLVERMEAGADLSQPDFSTFYTPGEKGYTDYLVLAEAAV